MRHSLTRSFAALAVVAVLAGSAAAHFVWIETKSTGAGLLVRSGFGEPDGWDPDLAEKMGSSTFWLRRPNGMKPLALPLDKQEQEYRATVTDAGVNAVLGATDWGVIAFGPNPPSHLRYTAKNLIGPPAAWGDDKPADELRIEVLAKLDGKHVMLKVLHLGKPLAGAKVNAYPPSGTKAELKTDDAGAAVWPVAESGLHQLYVGTTTESPGELNGKKYAALKDYATLTFTLP